MVIRFMIKNKKFAILFVLLIFLVGCTNNVPATEQVNIEDMIEEEKVEIAGNSYDIYLGSVTNYKYEDEKLIEKSDESTKSLYFYEDDLLVKAEVYSEGELKGMTFYTYDDKGRVIKRELISKDMEVKSYQINSYNGNNKEESYYNSDNELLSKNKFKLNDNNQKVKSIKNSDGKKPNFDVYCEYEKDNLIFRQIKEDNKVLSEFYFDYNEHGDEVSMITINFGSLNQLNGGYYVNEYEDSKLTKQTTYRLLEEIDNRTAEKIGKSLK